MAHAHAYAEAGDICMNLHEVRVVLEALRFGTTTLNEEDFKLLELVMHQLRLVVVPQIRSASQAGSRESVQQQS